MLKVGLTGGIGSGKSTVGKIFIALGIPMYDADMNAKMIMNTNHEVKNKIIEKFGPEAYTDNQLNRTYISNLVFNDKAKLDELNKLVHPATINDANNWFLQQVTPYSLKEAALIFESGGNKHLDYIIGVFAPEKIRIDRVIKRDSISAEQVKERINKQMNEEEKMKLCDFIIDNSGQKSLISQVLSLHNTLLGLAADKLNTPIK